MLLFSSASAAFHLRPLTASAHGRHACVRLSTDPSAASIAFPKFLVTTVKPESNADGKFVFDRYSQSVGELPVFLVDVKYEGKATVAGEWADSNDPGKGKKWNMDEGEGDFSGTAVSQAEFTSPSLLALLARASPRPKALALALALYSPSSGPGLSSSSVAIHVHLMPLAMWH